MLSLCSVGYFVNAVANKQKFTVQFVGFLSKSPWIQLYKYQKYVVLAGSLCLHGQGMT